MFKIKIQHQDQNTTKNIKKDKNLLSLSRLKNIHVFNT